MFVYDITSKQSKTILPVKKSNKTQILSFSLIRKGSPLTSYLVQLLLIKMVRFKHRYITVDISSPTVPDNKPLSLKSKIFHETVLNKIQQLHGDFGTAAVRTGFLTKYCNENTRIAILRSRHGPHKFVTSSLPFITKIGKLDVRLRTLHVGATLKHSFRFIQKHQREYLDRMWSTLKNDEERKQLEAAVMDFTKTDVAINIENIA